VILIFTLLMALSQFDGNLPKPVDFQTKTRGQIVQMYANTCLGFLSGAKDADGNKVDSSVMAGMLQTILASTTTGNGGNYPNKVKLDQLLDIFKRVCRVDPDPSALNSYAADIDSAQAKYLELQQSLPKIGNLKNIKLSESTELRAKDGSIVGEVFDLKGRRKYVPISSLPPYVAQTFVEIEDHRFPAHHGVDEFGILRAAFKNSSGTGRPEGGSTITQQVARNLFLNDELSFERKIKEMMLAGQIEAQLSKNEILDIYINLIYFGRNSYGIYKASQSYFGKSPTQLSPVETAFLVGIVHGPNLYQAKSPKLVERMTFVLNRMRQEKLIPDDFDIKKATDEFELPKNLSSMQANYFRDYLKEDQGVDVSSQAALQTTLNAKFQLTAERELQLGLVNFEKKTPGKRIWNGPLANVSPGLLKDIEEEKQNKIYKELAKSAAQDNFLGAIESEKKVKGVTPKTKEMPAWFFTLTRTSARFPVPVDTWEIAIVLDNSTVGLPTGKTVKISSQSLAWTRSNPLRQGDLVYVSQNLKSKSYEIEQVPRVNGAVVAMDAQTGEILAMAGGFSYAGINRATKALRQPGSLVKPFTYMTALRLGYQPNFPLSGSSITFPKNGPGGHPWTPRNYESGDMGTKPMRFGLEHSINTMTARLMSMINLAPIRTLTKEFGLYDNPIKYYPFILGAQETTLLNVVRSYAGIANNGYLVQPHGVISGNFAPSKIKGIDDITLFQTRYLMQGVLQHGTAARIADLAPFVAGKTGTTNEMSNAWFVGFTPKVVIGVYVGYDKTESLGSGSDGARVALPIFENVMRESFKFYSAPQEFPAAPPGVVFQPTNVNTGEIQAAMSADSILEAYRESAIKK
jgi:penicillin-binding protein 1A